MNVIQDLFEQELQYHQKLENVLTKVISKKFKEYGVILTEDQEEEIRRQIILEDFESMKIELSDEQEAQFNSEQRPERIGIELREDDLESYFLKLNEAMEHIIVDVPSTLGPILLDGFKELAPETLQQIELDNQAYQALVFERWNKPFALLEMLLTLCLEAGADFNDEFRPQAALESDFVFEALSRLHARGCQVGWEILTLLKHGFADGAYARWRTLHEIAVIAGFIKLHGNDVAERYLLHHVINDYLDAQDHQRHCKSLGWQPISRKEMKSLEDGYNELKVRYGNDFSKKYGWAASIFRKKNPKHNPTFSDIEKVVGLAQARPFYIVANLNVHASAKSVFFRLGLPPTGKDILVAGPSYYGLAEPGSAMAWTISILTTTLLTHKPNLDRLAVLGAFHMLVGEVYDAFSKTEVDGTAEEDAAQNGAMLQLQ